MSNAQNIYYQKSPVLKSTTKGGIDSIKALQGSSRLYLTKYQGFKDHPKDTTSEQLIKSHKISYGKDHYLDSSGAVRSSKDSKRRQEDTT